MSFSERPVLFPCEGQRLLGVLCEPTAPTAKSDLGMVIVVGGPQVRTGSHRQFVLQARAAAAHGVPTLRFDVRGMGDSEGAPRDFEHLSADIAAAIDALQQACASVRRVVLWGLCDGASAALLYLDEHDQDPRVSGLVLLNPWVRSEATLAATHVKHYYTRRLRQREFWVKLLRGRVAGASWTGLLRSLKLTLQPRAKARHGTDAYSADPYPRRMSRAWGRFGGRVLLILSGDDYTAKEFLHAWETEDWARARAHPALRRVDVPGADHTFSHADSHQSMLEACTEWLTDPHWEAA